MGSWAIARPAARRAGLASRQPGGKPVFDSAKITASASKSVAAITAQQQPVLGPERPGEGLPVAAGLATLAARAGATSLQPSGPLSAKGRSAAEAGLLARLAALQPAVWPAPAAPQLVAVEPSPRPRPLGGRWAVQALAGPALTYRHLGAAPTASISGPTRFPIATAYNFASTTPVAELERPALGAGAQVSIRRALGPHWAVSTGLGYTEYAIRLALQQVPSAADSATRIVPPNQSVPVPTSIHRRDTYRFVTVPLRVAYNWTLTGRWRVGALAGADAAFYVGGSSTEGSTCACQARTWSATGSPYRRLSLGASLGAEVRYRLTDRWELLAQPTASYLLSPLASAGAGYYARHLFGGTALLGASFDLP